MGDGVTLGNDIKTVKMAAGWGPSGGVMPRPSLMSSSIWRQVKIRGNEVKELNELPPELIQDGRPRAENRWP